MQIGDSRKNNLLVLRGVSRWLGHPEDSLTDFYLELIENRTFLKELSDQMENSANFKNNPPGIFARTPISNPDWFGLQRVFLYCVVRLTKPQIVVETGVYYGGNSSFILEALEKNKSGKLIGLDLPHNSMNFLQDKARHPWVGDSELYKSEFEPGFIIPQYLRSRFDLRIGDSVGEIDKIAEVIDFFVHDSEHTYVHVESELNAAINLMSEKGLILVDDIDWSNAFYDFLVRHNLYPFILPDNGKDDLRFRTGLLRLNHRNNDLRDVTLR